ncbi:MAG: sigma-70 family RNA polymerase sigma factor [Phycisphaerales bacterium]|nr:sigma-70 family RNA polymerase sigma factor [Phycisphaerales bacterium]
MPLLTAEEERTLGWNIQNDRCAVSRDRMVRANLRLVVCIAKSFTGRGLDMADLVAEGNLGLLRAVDRFDPAHGARFSTYGSWWIKQAIRRGIRTSREIVHVPNQIQDVSARLQRESARHEAATGISMNPQEILAMMSVTSATTTTVRRALSHHLSNSRASASSVGEQSLPDTRELSPDGRMLRREQLDRAHALLQNSNAREAAAIRMRFGLSGHAPQSLSHIGEALGISRESARKLLSSALEAMGDEMVA